MNHTKSSKLTTILVVIIYFVKYYSIQNKSKKKTNSQKREKAIASVPKKLKFRVFSLSGDGPRRLL